MVHARRRIDRERPVRWNAAMTLLTADLFDRHGEALRICAAPLRSVAIGRLHSDEDGLVLLPAGKA
jgi:hypothetical protein